MKNNTKLLAGLLVPAVLMILPLCCKGPQGEKSKPITETTKPKGTNFFLGTWAGEDQRGSGYTIQFEKNLQWNSRIGRAGATRYHYKGIYAFTGNTVWLTVTHELDPATSIWREVKGTMPTNLEGTISGNTLKVANILTEAELKRR